MARKSQSMVASQYRPLLDAITVPDWLRAFADLIENPDPNFDPPEACDWVIAFGTEEVPHRAALAKAARRHLPAK